MVVVVLATDLPATPSAAAAAAATPAAARHAVHTRVHITSYI